MKNAFKFTLNGHLISLQIGGNKMSGDEAFATREEAIEALGKATHYLNHALDYPDNWHECFESSIKGDLKIMEYSIAGTPGIKVVTL